MSPLEAQAQALIRMAYGVTIFYTGAGLAGDPIIAIKSDVAADDFQGAGRSLRRIAFEVDQADLPGEPRKNDMIDADGTIWRVNDVTRRDDIGAWDLVVQK